MPGHLAAEDEVAQLCSDLVRIDTTNPGDHSGPGERTAAEYVSARLAEAGLEPQIFESHPKRTSLVARIEGTDPARPALLVHGHLDVVPADAGDWQVHPFSGEITESCVWGRGAVDMKDMDAMILAVIRQRLREGRRPPRDIVLAFLADEEAGGSWGARWLVDNHPDLFAGCTEAIGEVGGFSYTLQGPSGPQRMYLLQTAEKGMAWLRLTTRGTAGHGSMLNDDNAVTKLADAIARLGRHEFGIRLTPSVRAFLEQAAEVLEVEFSPDRCQEILDKLAELDGVLGPHIQREFTHRDIALETTPDGELFAAMSRALLAEDPAARVVPYCLSGGTDAKSFARLGIRCFGFAPLRLPSDLDFSGMFHGVDERVPVSALRFGTRVLDKFFDQC